MLNRALVQPDPVVYLGMVADMMQAARQAQSLPALFLALEEAGIMLRIDRSVAPTMARAPTLGTWELELLRSIGDVVRLGHVLSVRRGRIELEQGSVDVAPDAVVRVPLSALVGWSGAVTPRLGALAAAGGDEAPGPGEPLAVELVGEGRVLVDAGASPRR
jgi:hypothetical protein